MDVMDTKFKLTDESANVAFYWTRDPEFVLPGKNGGLEACVEQEFTASRTTDLKTLLNTFLETATSFIKAKAAVVRVLLPDEQTLQVISAVGLTGEELEAERIVELACEDCGKDAFKHGLCSTNIDSCNYTKWRPAASTVSLRDLHSAWYAAIPLKSCSVFSRSSSILPNPPPATRPTWRAVSPTCWAHSSNTSDLPGKPNARSC